jgi:hypothetical protein
VTLALTLLPTYLLGYTLDAFGIWDRFQPGAPIRRFPRTDDGWREAWAAYVGMEPHRAEVGITGSTDAGVTTVKEFTLAGVPIRNVQFIVGGSQPGRAVGLLGQNVLHLADVEYDLAHGAIRLLKPQGCEKSDLAYWAQSGERYSVIEIAWATQASPHTTGTALVIGVKVRVVFDTGAAFSLLSLRAAERAGVTPDSAGVVKAGLIGGLGTRSEQTWLAPIDSFNIGGALIERKSNFSLSVNGRSDYTTPNLNVAMPAGTRAEVLNLRQPNNNVNVNALVDYALTKDQILRVVHSQFVNTSKNLGIGAYDLQERAFSRENRGLQFRLQEAGPIGSRLFLNTRVTMGLFRATAQSALDAPKARRAVGVLPDPLPSEAEVARVTLTRSSILSARTVLITITGQQKRELLEQAIADGHSSKLPIGRVLAEAEQPIDIHWCP